MSPLFSFFFFFNDTATTEIYTLSLHDALPISRHLQSCLRQSVNRVESGRMEATWCKSLRKFAQGDRKSTRLNSSHLVISYAVFCLKKKKQQAIHEYVSGPDQSPHHQHSACHTC